MKELKARCGNFHDKLHTCQSAVGEKSGETVLYFRKESSGQASLLNDWEGTTKDSLRVPVTTLDDAIAKYGKPDYVKIDVEGYEFNVLQGLTYKIPLISFEYHLREREIKSVQNCLDYLSQLGQLHINITPSESMEFAFKEWIKLEEFLTIFPKEFRDRKGYFYGDIFAHIT